MLPTVMESVQDRYQKTLDAVQSDAVLGRVQGSALMKQLVEAGNFQGALDLLEIYCEHQRRKDNPEPPPPRPIAQPATPTPIKVSPSLAEEPAPHPAPPLIAIPVEVDGRRLVKYGNFTIAEVPGGFQIFGTLNWNVRKILRQPVATQEEAQRIIDEQFKSCPVPFYELIVREGYRYQYEPPTKLPSELFGEKKPAKTKPPDPGVSENPNVPFTPEDYGGYRIERYKRKKKGSRYKVLLRVGEHLLPVVQGLRTPTAAREAIDRKFEGCLNVEWEKVVGHPRFRADLYLPDSNCPCLSNGYEIVHVPLAGYRVKNNAGKMVSLRTYSSLDTAIAAAECDFATEPVGAISWEHVHKIPPERQEEVAQFIRTQERARAKQREASKRDAALRQVPWVKKGSQLNYFNNEDLQQRGWNKPVIEILLFPPDAQTEKSRSKKPTFLYCIERVLLLESTPEFQSQTAKKNTDPDEIEDESDSSDELLKHIASKVPRLSKFELVQKACVYYNQAPKPEGVEYRTTATPASPRDFLDRLSVEFLCNRLHPYECSIVKAMNRSQPGQWKNRVRSCILEAIVLVYPHLEDACAIHRLDWLRKEIKVDTTKQTRPERFYSARVSPYLEYNIKPVSTEATIQ